MKYGVMHVNSSSIESTSPTMRIAKFVAAELNAPLIHNRESALQWLKTKFDVLFVKHGLLKFSDHREQAIEIYDKAQMTVNLENDYTFKVDSRFKEPDETWSTVAGKTRYINYNVITRLPLERWKIILERPNVTREGLIYYGAHRVDRVPSFVRYFHNAPYPITISSFRGGQKFFATCGKHVEIVGAFRDPLFPTAWPMTIYIEDETSHTLYCSPATRFYECLQMGLSQVVDKASVSTLQRAGFKVPDFMIVENQADVAKSLKNWQGIYAKQVDLWWRDFAGELRKQFWAAMKASFNDKRG
jgi:hypothetical protein